MQINSETRLYIRFRDSFERNVPCDRIWCWIRDLGFRVLGVWVSGSRGLGVRDLGFRVFVLLLVERFSTSSK